jgi:hypothetical protein
MPRPSRATAHHLVEIAPTAIKRRVSLIPVRPGEGRLTEPTTAVQPWKQEPLFVPHCGHSEHPQNRPSWW